MSASCLHPTSPVLSPQISAPQISASQVPASRAPAARGAASHAIAVGLTRAADAVLHWLQRDRDRRALQRLDDRLLHDIGVSRAEVEAEVAKPFWRG